MKNQVRIIKKYPNRRLYDTEESRYITLADIRNLILDQTDIKVIDKQCQKDITTIILLQVIAEQEQHGQSMLNRDLLLGIIHAYGSGMSQLITNYLDQSLKLFICHRQSIRGLFQGGIDIDPASTIDTAKENFQRWMELQKKVCKSIMEQRDSYSDTGANQPRGTNHRES